MYTARFYLDITHGRPGIDDVTLQRDGELSFVPAPGLILRFEDTARMTVDTVAFNVVENKVTVFGHLDWADDDQAIINRKQRVEEWRAHGWR